MEMITVIAIAFGLAMDAFAVSLTSGIAIRHLRIKHALKLAIFFGSFQAIMPLSTSDQSALGGYHKIRKRESLVTQKSPDLPFNPTHTLMSLTEGLFDVYSAWVKLLFCMTIYWIWRSSPRKFPQSCLPVQAPVGFSLCLHKGCG